MHDRDDLDLWVALEETFDFGCIDRIVVRHLELVDVGAKIAEPVAHALAEDAGDEVQHRGPGAHEGPRGRLEAQHGLALHQHDVRSRLQDLRNLSLGAAEAVEERGVVVVRDRRAERGERPRAGASSVWTRTRDASPFADTFIVIAASSEPCARVSVAFARRTARLLESSCSAIQSEPLYPRRIGPSRTVTFAG